MCLFCKIANKEIPSNIVYEDDKVVAILDLSPLTDHHTLVIPKKHFKNLIDVDETTLTYVMSTARKLAVETMKQENRKGFNLLVNNNEEANQTVNHLHVHIVYRDKSDEIHHLRKK